MMLGHPASDPVVQSLRDEAARLRRAVEELSILNDLAKTIGASLDSRQIMDTIVRRSVRAVNAEQGVITLVDHQQRDPQKTFVRVMDTSAEHERLRPTEHLLGWMHINKKPILIADPRDDDRFRGVRWDESVRSVLCVPMMIKSELTGVLTVYNKKGTQAFSDDDQRLLAILAAQSAQVIENARLIERERQLVKMQEELRLAAKIQTELLPRNSPVVPGYRVAGKSIPAQMIGGDYYDFLHVDKTHLAFCLGDVSGKGLPASLLMASTQATVRGQAIHGLPPAECVARSSRMLYETTEPEKFVTLLYGLLDFGGHVLSYTNAGHEQPYLIGPDGDVRRLDKGGIALGMLEEFPFDQETVPFSPGSTLIICSDGITEAMDANGAQFGDARLGALVREHRGVAPEALIEAIVTAVRWHAGTTPQADDMTLVVIQRAS
jgi:sigma-B regulation protein RsbU (phosphoserine phosphatase)